MAINAAIIPATISDKDKQMVNQLNYNDMSIVNVPFVIKLEMIHLNSQVYSILVDPRRMLTIGDLKNRIKYLFGLDKEVICLNGDGIIPDLESIDIVCLVDILRIQLSEDNKSLALEKKNLSSGPRETFNSDNPEILTPAINDENSEIPSKRKAHTKSLSVGEFLQNLRLNTSGTSENGTENFEGNLTSDCSFTLQPSKRKRIRKHKSKKLKEGIEGNGHISCPPPQSYTVESLVKPKHYRFDMDLTEPTHQKDDNVEAAEMENDKLECEVVSLEKDNSVTHDLDALFSLKNTFRSPALFVRTPTKPEV